MTTKTTKRTTTKSTAKKTAAKKTTTVKKTATAKKPESASEISKIRARTINWVKGAENPFREGSGARERVEHLRKFSGKTVEEFVRDGGLMRTVRNGRRFGLVTCA